MKPNDKSPEARRETADVWLQVRVRESEKELWRACAEREDISMSQWVIGCLNAAVEESK